MNALALAKRRAALRHRERGAVMFIVAMTLAVLASVGVYALAAAATEVRTSGNERQNTQTHYLAEYGVLGMAHEVNPGNASWIVRHMKLPADTSCVSLQGVPTGATANTLECMRFPASQLGQAWTQPFVVPYGGTSGAAPYTKGIPPGSLGSTPTKGDFFVELTESMQTPARGTSSNANFCFFQVTATSVGLTQPTVPGVTDPTALFGAEGVETQRARLIVGPAPCL
jgi:Tfp pilus assembly protein PilX